MKGIPKYLISIDDRIYPADLSAFFLAEGMQLEGRSANYGSANEKYKFTGKERDIETGYDYFGARYYDSRIGRWSTTRLVEMSVDPLAEKYPDLSPYNYTLNNPLRFDDPDGKGANDRVEAARKLTTFDYYQETDPTLRIENTTEALANIDCSEFVSRVLSADGITSGVENMDTKRLRSFLSNEEQFDHGLKPQDGDIALWEGHAGIVSGVDKKGNIKLIHAANETRGIYENTNYTSPEKYRESKFLGYFRPKKETPDGKDVEPTRQKSAQQLRAEAGARKKAMLRDALNPEYDASNP